MNGRILKNTPGINHFEKLYISIFGAPISGLRIRLRRILPYIKSLEGSILDAGCGRGVFSFETAFFKEGDIENLSFHEEFDSVLSVDNLEHLQNDTAGILALYKALKPGGKLILHVPGYERIWFFREFTTNFDVPGHFRPGYHKELISEKIESCGFLIEHSQYTYGWYETVSNNISYFITKAEAKNKAIYALIFPVINLMSWMGRNASPANGAGVLLIAIKPLEQSTET